jgi:hypothetical protein
LFRRSQPALVPILQPHVSLLELLRWVIAAALRDGALRRGVVRGAPRFQLIFFLGCLGRPRRCLLECTPLLRGIQPLLMKLLYRFLVSAAPPRGSDALARSPSAAATIAFSCCACADGRRRPWCPASGSCWTTRAEMGLRLRRAAAKTTLAAGWTTAPAHCHTVHRRHNRRPVTRRVPSAAASARSARTFARLGMSTSIGRGAFRLLRASFRRAASPAATVWSLARTPERLLLCLHAAPTHPRRRSALFDVQTHGNSVSEAVPLRVAVTAGLPGAAP